MNFITNLNNENDNGNNIFFEENINTDNVNGNEDDEFLDENMIDDFQKKSKSQELYEKLCLINFNDNEIDLTKYNNNIIANTLIIYIIKKMDPKKNEDLQIVKKYLEHIVNNIYNSDDYMFLQFTLVKCIFCYMLKIYNLIVTNFNFDNTEQQIYNHNYTNINILNDEMFIIFINSISWNKLLFSYFLKLLSVIDHQSCFSFIYDKAINSGYNINLEEMVNFICDPYFTENFENNNNLNIYGNLNCINILKLILTKIPEQQRIKIIEIFYSKKNGRDIYSKYIDIFVTVDIDFINIYTDPDVNNNNINIYKYFPNESKLIKDKIMISLINKNIKNYNIYNDCITLFNLNPQTFIINAIQHVNIFYTQNFVSYDYLYNDIDLLFNILVSLFRIKYRFMYKHFMFLLKMLMKKNIINKLSKQQINYLTMLTVKNSRSLLFEKIFKYFIKNNNDVTWLFNYIESYNFCKKMFGLFDKHNILINFDDSDNIHLIFKNNYLTKYLIKNNKLNNITKMKLITLILKLNLGNQNFILIYLLENCNYIFNINFCNRLYTNKLYSALCIYLKNTQHNLNYDIIKKNYKNIITCHYFQKLLYHMNLNKTQASDLLNNVTCKYKRRVLQNYMKYVLKLDI